MTIVEFLTVRLAEREQAALACTAAWPEAEKIYDEVYRLALPIHDDQETGEWDVRIRREEARFIASNGPAEILADIAAKRDILKQYGRALENSRDHPDDLASKGALLALLGVLRQLALPHADHPDYEPGLKP